MFGAHYTPRPPDYSVFVTNHSSKNTAVSRFFVYVANNLYLLVPQVLMLCVARRPHFLQMVACFHHLTDVQTSVFVRNMS